MAFYTTSTAKVSETRWRQVLGALLFIINDLQNVTRQELDVKKRRCKSWFSATPATSFSLPKRSPYLGISIKKPFCICKSPINMIYYNRVYVVYKFVYISNRQIGVNMKEEVATQTVSNTKTIVSQITTNSSIKDLSGIK